jgi:hypothetical protein
MTRQEARHRARHRLVRRRRRAVVIALMAVTVILVGVDFARGGTSGVPDPSTLGLGSGSDGAEPAAPPEPTATAPAQRPRPGQSPAVPVVNVPRHGPGTFTVASGESARVGAGKLMTYRVETEDGSGEAADTFAAAVDDTLADPRSWTAKGEWAFHRVSKGRVDFVVRLSTPDTVDRICGAVGLKTGGYTSCRAGVFVVLNLDRWENAVPEYRGNVSLYRRYVINHEVGHRLGHGHELCPGAGRPAPVMQQQTLGMHGCVVNGWPFVNGRYVNGPPTSAN